ncbi:hypothetical protein ABZP36_005679 [Zizania latifolia]
MLMKVVDVWVCKYMIIGLYCLQVKVEPQFSTIITSSRKSRPQFTLHLFACNLGSVYSFMGSNYHFMNYVDVVSFVPVDGVVSSRYAVRKNRCVNNDKPFIIKLVLCF